MAKKSAYFAEAERLYVTESCTLEEISARLRNVSVRSLQDWKTEANWENKRRQFIQQKESFSEELYGLTRKLMESIKTDIDNKNDPSQSKLYTLTKLLDSMNKVKKYEDSAADAVTDITENRKPMPTKEELAEAFRKGLMDTVNE